MAELDLLGLLEGSVRTIDGADGTRPRVYGVVAGVITSVDDRKKLGRVKVRFTFGQRVESAWARVAAPWAGPLRGAYFAPEVDDEVLVAFHNGDLGHPYILGFLWNQGASAPLPLPPQASPQPRRSVIRSAKGNAVVLDDRDGAERLELTSKSGHRIALDDGAQSTDVTIADASGRVTVSLDGATGAIKVSAEQVGSISLSAPQGSVSISASRISLDGDVVQINGRTLVAINS